MEFIMFKQSIAMAILVAGLTACSGGGKSVAEMYGGDYFFASKEKNNQKVAFKSIKPAAGIVQLMIEGETVEMWSKAYAEAQMEEQPITNNISLAFYNSRDVFWLAIKGKLTSLTEMPKTGVATYKYKGDIKGGSASTFKVDFGKKTVNGEIYDQEGRVELPTSHIEGNAFHYEDAKQEVRGHFFGKNAAELGGIWIGTTNDFRVIPFAATKQ